MLIVTGMSGSGKSIVLKTLEDLGYYCVDNLPIQFLSSFARDFVSQRQEPVAIAIDSRNAAQPEDLISVIHELNSITPSKILFLNTSNQVLIRRYSESRRPHPLIISNIGENRVVSAIEKEREILKNISSISDDVIDTSNLKDSDLKAEIIKRYHIDRKELIISVQSFGFKKGVPANADFVFDVRFLPNPYWEVSLRKLNGTDQEIQKWLLKFDETTAFINETSDYLLRWIPKFLNQDRSYLTIAIGCTGGQHRSVFISEAIAKKLAAQFKNININHPDMKR